MAYVPFSGAGVWIPASVALDITVLNTTYVIDASGEKAVLVVQCPKDGTLDRFDTNIVVTNSPDNGLRFSFQAVDTTTGQNSGTVLGATNNAFVTYAHTVTTGWKSTNFGETVTVTRGQLIACVVDIPSFTASDNVAVGAFQTFSAVGLPYGLTVTGTKQGSNLMIAALHYTDGYVYIHDLIPGADTAPTVVYNSGTGVADEWGVGFQLPAPCKIGRVSVTLAVAAGADHEVLVYDSASTVLATATRDGDITPGTGAQTYTYVLPTELTLTANTTYRVSVRPTTANNVTMRYLTFQSVDLMKTMAGGSNFYMTSRLNQTGAWTDYNSGTFRRPHISLHLTEIDDGTGGGGGGSYGMVGG